MDTSVWGSEQPSYSRYGQNPIIDNLVHYQQPNTVHLHFGAGSMSAAAPAAFGNRPPRFAAGGANGVAARLAAYLAGTKGYGISNTQT